MVLLRCWWAAFAGVSVSLFAMESHEVRLDAAKTAVDKSDIVMQQWRKLVQQGNDYVQRGKPRLNSE